MPYCETITTAQSLHIAVWHLSEELPTLLAMWGDEPLPYHYHASNNEKRCREIVATALLLRQYFGKDVAWHHTPEGAPRIDNYNISISHTHDYVAIALHPTRRVGIDIETIQERALRIAPRFMSESELAQLPPEEELLPDGTASRAIAIHMTWSIKEAVYKIHSTAVDFRNHIAVAQLHALPHGTTTVHLPATDTTIEAHYRRYDSCSLAWVID
jgi:4'-phosphopantetheinyl transferase EntD